MNRTCDTRIRNPVLYPLSYGGKNLNMQQFLYFRPVRKILKMTISTFFMRIQSQKHYKGIVTCLIM